MQGLGFRVQGPNQRVQPVGPRSIPKKGGALSFLKRVGLRVRGLGFGDMVSSLKYCPFWGPYLEGPSFLGSPKGDPSSGSDHIGFGVYVQGLGFSLGFRV